MRNSKAVYVRAIGGMLLSLSLFFLPMAVSFAATNPTNSDNPATNSTNSDNPGTLPTNSDTPVDYGNTYASQPNTLQNPLGVDSFCKLTKVILNAALVIGIPIAVLFIVYAGFKFILARGSATGLTEARNNLFYTLIGVAIFIGASVIAGVIINTLAALGAGNISSC